MEDIYSVTLDCVRQNKVFETFNPLVSFEVDAPINNIWVSFPSAEYIRDLIIYDLEQIYNTQKINKENFQKIKNAVGDYQNRVHNCFFQGATWREEEYDALHQRSTPIFQILYGFDYIMKQANIIDSLKAAQQIQSIFYLYSKNPEKIIKEYKSSQARYNGQKQNQAFREHFKKKQKDAFDKNPKLTANAFAWAFYNNPTMDIPYSPQNKINRLIKLAQANNREFKKSKLALTDQN
jgi:hypothetical protein